MSYLLLKWLTVVWMLAIVVLSLSPAEVKIAAGTETRSHVRTERRRVFDQHRAAHYLAFSVGAVLLVAIGQSDRSRAVLCLSLIALGCTLEVLQYLLFHFRLETWDMRDDAIAVILGYSIALLIRVPAYAPRPRTIADAPMR